MFDLSHDPYLPASQIQPDPQFELAAEVETTFAINADELHSRLNCYDLLIVDLRPKEHGEEGYIPGSVHLDYAALARRHGSTDGLIPSPEKMSKVLSEIGLQPWHYVIAYDDETGVEAARLLWSLAAVGHQRYALLNGGFEAWQTAGLPVSTSIVKPVATEYAVKEYGAARVGKEYVHAAMNRDDVCLVDTRSFAEYSGEEIRAQQGGHIPGAIHFNWMDALDLFGDGGLRDPDQLRTKLSAKGITPNKEVIVYCQTNRRSAHTFVVLKWLGFENVKAYDGSWSEWGNDPELPVAA
jgi:thiosulfate/3-mercaptopyruvate sulfurtransferase